MYPWMIFVSVEKLMTVAASAGPRVSMKAIMACLAASSLASSAMLPLTSTTRATAIGSAVSTIGSTFRPATG